MASCRSGFVVALARVLLMLLAILVFGLLATVERARRGERILMILALAMGFGLLWGLVILLSPLRLWAGMDTPPRGVSILSDRRLGDAHFTVLRAATPEALDTWLVGQSLRPLDAAARSVVSQYIQDHWCFVAGRLEARANERSVPRPLLVTFPVSQPIFPMKLTALARSRTHVDLCLIADQQACAAGFHCVAADRMHRVEAEKDPEERFPGASQDFYESCEISGARYEGESMMLAIGHPDLQARLWPECVVTRLTADLSPAEMTQDVLVSLAPLMPHQDTYYTYASRKAAVLGTLAVIMELTLLLALFWVWRRPWRREFRLGVLALTMALLYSGVIYLRMPAGPGVSRTMTRFFFSYQGRQLSAAARELATQGVIHPGMSSQELAALPERMLALQGHDDALDVNVATGQTIRHGCSPGDFAIRTIQGRSYFCRYDLMGLEFRSLLPVGKGR